MITWNKKDMIEWYDKHAEDKEITDDQIVSVQSARYKRIVEEVEKLVSLMSFGDDDCVLDAGCGSGRFIHKMRKTESCQIFGIDTSRHMIKRARKRAPNANFLIADVLHLPFRSESFTAVVCYSVLWHIPSESGASFFNFDVYEGGLKEFKRVLGLGGRVLFNITNPLHPQSVIDFFVSFIRVKLLKNVGLQTYKMPLGTVESILTKLGFRVSDVVAGGYFPVLLETLYVPFHLSPSEKMINKYYDSFCHLRNFVGQKIWLHFFAHTFVVKAIRMNLSSLE